MTAGWILAAWGGCAAWTWPWAEVSFLPETVLELEVTYPADSDIAALGLWHAPVPCHATDPPRVLEQTVVDFIEGSVTGDAAMLALSLDVESRQISVVLELPGEHCRWVQVRPMTGPEEDSAWCDSGQVLAPAADSGGRSQARVELSCQPIDGNVPCPSWRDSVIPNHPPVAHLDDGPWTAGQCEPVQLCVETYDPDDDSVIVDWTWLEPADVIEVDEPSLKAVGFDDGHREWRACVDVAGTVPGFHAADVLVRDLGYGAKGVQLPMEDVVPECGPSRAERQAQLDVSWVAEPLCFDDDGELVADPTQERVLVEGCEPTPADQWWCSGAHDVDPERADALCDGPHLRAEALYPDCVHD